MAGRKYRIEVLVDGKWVEVGTGNRMEIGSLVAKAIDYPYRTEIRVVDLRTGMRLPLNESRIPYEV